MRRAIVASILFTASLAAAPTVKAFSPIIVTDPGNIAVNVEQLLQHLQLIRRVEAQIRNQLLMLENWEFTRLEAILAEMDRMREVLEQARVYDADDLGQRVDRVYPIDIRVLEQARAESLNTARTEWARQHREALVQARAIQNRAYASMPRTAERIAEYLEQSTQSPGPTAAVQAGNELLGTLVGQVQTLESLEITANREALEREAARQAEEARTRFRRKRLMRDWPVSSGGK